MAPPDRTRRLPRPSRLARFAVLLFAAFACTEGLAHADLDFVDPAADAVVAGAPETMTIAFSEAVDVRFSRIEVHRLDADPGDEPDFESLNERAGARAAELLDAGDEDADTRADDGVVTTEDRAAEIVVALRPGLEPGAYLVVWRVLSEDTHAVEGHSVFVVEDAAP